MFSFITLEDPTLPNYNAKKTKKRKAIAFRFFVFFAFPYESRVPERYIHEQIAKQAVMNV